jgi:hypothetical protein
MARSLKSKICANRFSPANHGHWDFEVGQKELFFPVKGHGNHRWAGASIRKEKGIKAVITPGRPLCLSYPTHPIYRFI